MIPGKNDVCYIFAGERPKNKFGARGQMPQTRGQMPLDTVATCLNYHRRSSIGEGYSVPKKTKVGRLDML